MTDCRNCRRDTELYLCQPCTRELAGLLADLPGWLRELETTVIRQDRLTIGEVGHSSDNPSPINVGAMELRRTLDGQLGTLVRELCEERAITPPRWATDARTAALWLAVNTAAIACSEGAGETFEEIRHAKDAILTAINRSSRMYCGPCLNTIDNDGVEEQCGADLYADRESLEMVQCPKCKAYIDPRKQLVTWAATARGDLLTLDQLVESLEVDAGTVKGWVYRGRLRIRGYIGDDGQVTPKRKGDCERVFSLAQARGLQGNYRALHA